MNIKYSLIIINFIIIRAPKLDDYDVRLLPKTPMIKWHLGLENY